MTRLLKISSIATVAFAAAAIAAAAIYLNQSTPVESFDRVRAAYRKSDVLVLDRNGEVIHEVRVDDTVRRLKWTRLVDVSPALVSAVIESEDRRFRSHNGVDWLSAAGAAVQNVLGSKRRGASTITMQLAAMLDPGLRAGSSRKSFAQKLRQARAAYAIEESWTKDEVLEAYLNRVYFRGELQGVAAASHGLFGKAPHGVGLVEGSILASLIRSPNADTDETAQRACRIYDALDSGSDCEDVKERVAAAFASAPAISRPVALAKHAARLVVKRGVKDADSVIKTTLDARVQRFAIETLRRNIRSVRDRNVRDGAIVVIENKTGDILAYAGGSEEMSSAPDVDGARAPRQAGSTLKPFLYALALDMRLITPATLIDDSPLDIPVAGGVYHPNNYDGEFMGHVPARVALASSLNVPAVKTLRMTGTDEFLTALRSLGFKTLVNDADYYGPSLALGSADVTLVDLTNAYRTLANGGVRSAARLTFVEARGRGVKRVYSEEAAFIVADMLSDRAARAPAFGLDNSLSTRYGASVKTGTSKDMRDNWCIGFTEKYTVGVWVGNFSGKPMWDVSGVTGAAPIWAEVINRLHEDINAAPSRRAPLKTPQGVVSAKTGAEGRAEWFIKGTEPGTFASASRGDLSNPVITYPVDGMMLAVDPGIPDGLQKVFFAYKPVREGLKLRLNGEALDAEDGLAGWTPVPGKYSLDLINPDGTVLGAVAFEVRGGDAAGGR